jgi:hypothetical protein
MIMNEYLKASGRVLWASSQGKGSLCWHVHVSKSRMPGARCAHDYNSGVQTQPKIGWGVCGCGYGMWVVRFRSGRGADVVLAGYEHFTAASRNSARVGGAERLDNTAAGAPVYFATRSCADPISLLGAKTGIDGKGWKCIIAIASHQLQWKYQCARASRVGMGTSLSCWGDGMCDATREAEGVGRIGESPTSVARCAGLRGGKAM